MHKTLRFVPDQSGQDPRNFMMIYEENDSKRSTQRLIRLVNIQCGLL